MADYKDIITGTINSIVDKAKDLAENSSVREIYDNGLNRAKSYGKVAKMVFEVNGETEELKKVYTEIGKLYYEQTKDAPEGYFVPLFEQVKRISDSILAKEEAVRSIRASMHDDGECEEDCSDIDVEIGEFDDVVSSDEDENK